MSLRLDTNKFQDIIEFYNLRKVIQFYKIYNRSLYLNFFNGYEQVKRMICALQYSFAEEFLHSDFNFEECRDMFISAIFHKFNYKVPHANLTNDKDIAQSSYKIFCKREDKDIYNSILKMIDVAWISPNDLKKREYLTDYHNLLIDALHSMVFFENFPFHIFLKYVLEDNGEVDIGKYSEYIRNYFNSLEFVTPIFSEAWKEDKKDLLDESIDFILNKTLGIGINYFITEYRAGRLRLTEDLNYYNFEIVK